jgi:hypothetical protein
MNRRLIWAPFLGAVYLYFLQRWRLFVASNEAEDSQIVVLFKCLAKINKNDVGVTNRPSPSG